jgi:hypothetical protein
MDTNKTILIIFLALFIWLCCPFLFWSGLDRWLSWKGKRPMGSHHVHHIILGLWPFLTAYLGLHFYGTYSFQIGLFLLTLTAAVYFFCSLWDIRYVYTHDSPEYWLSPLLCKLARSYPILIMTFSCIVLTFGVALLIITPLNLSKDIRSLIAISALIFDYLVISLLFRRFILVWEKQSKW